MCVCSAFIVDRGMVAWKLRNLELGKDVGFGGGYECTKI
jgi:hypothetical protein